MMGLLAPDGPCRTCNCSDRGAAALEHPSAAALPCHLPRCCGVPRAEGWASPKPCQLDGAAPRPQHPLGTSGKGSGAPLQPQGLCGPGTRGRSLQSISPGPQRAVGLTCQEQTQATLNPPGLGIGSPLPMFILRRKKHIPLRHPSPSTKGLGGTLGVLWAATSLIPCATGHKP